tara:strand:- start:1593 stop:2099 length:507 start_codon:yes stop_codon:yes gene_type:complete
MKMIVAVCAKRKIFGGGIGYKNRIPWKLPSDMKHFKKKTIGNGNNAVIMGRKTWESLPAALPKRDNLILSKTLSLPNAFKTIPELEKWIDRMKYDEVWVIGGNTIYEQFIGKTDRLYVTNIHKYYTCDTFFPYTMKYSFTLDKMSDMFEENNIPYQFLEFTNQRGDCH